MIPLIVWRAAGNYHCYNEKTVMLLMKINHPVNPFFICIPQPSIDGNDLYRFYVPLKCHGYNRNQTFRGAVSTYFGSVAFLPRVFFCLQLEQCFCTHLMLLAQTEYIRYFCLARLLALKNLPWRKGAGMNQNQNRQVG